MKEKLCICKQNRRDCFAYRSRRCKVLSDTNFNKICPFYKSKDQKKLEEEKTEEHLWGYLK